MLTPRSVCSFHHAQGRAIVRFVWWPWVQGSKKDKDSKKKKRKMQFCSQHTRRTQQASSHRPHIQSSFCTFLSLFHSYWVVESGKAFSMETDIHTHTHVRWWVVTINCKLNCTENHKFLPIWVCLSCFFSSFFAYDVMYQEELNRVFGALFCWHSHSNL